MSLEELKAELLKLAQDNRPSMCGFISGRLKMLARGELNDFCERSERDALLRQNVSFEIRIAGLRQEVGELRMMRDEYQKTQDLASHNLDLMTKVARLEKEKAEWEMWKKSDP